MMTVELYLLLVLVSASGLVLAYDPPVFSDVSTTTECQDLDPKCSVWASQGECTTNAVWMMGNCRRSCQSCQGGVQAWKLRTHLAEVYDNETNDESDQNRITKVTIETIKLNHITLDEKAETMSIHGKIVQSWKDTRVQWEEYKWGVAWLNFYWLQIWTPQLKQIDGVSSTPGKVEGTELAANHTGQVYSWSDFSMTAPCEFNYHRFPTDKQNCCFRMDSKRYFEVDFMISDVAENYGRDAALKSHITGWKVQDFTIKPNKYKVHLREDWRKKPNQIETNNIDVCVSVQRNAAYFSSEIVGPCVATVVVTLSSFIVGSFWNQIVLLITSLIMQILSIIIVNTRLPPTTSSTPAIVKFAGFNLGMTLLLLVISLVLLNLACSKSQLPPPRIIDTIVNVLSRILPCVNVEVNETRLGDSGSEKATAADSMKNLHWLPMCRVLKYLVFVVYLAIYILTLIATFAA